MRLILHADDLGLSQSVNDAIFALMDERKLTSASIIANGPAFYDAVTRAKEFPQSSFGVHLNVTEFEPLSGRMPLCSPDGVLREWSAQLNRLLQAGITVSHVDSHHHVHTRMTLFPALQALCTFYGVRTVRPRHTFTGHGLISRCRLDRKVYNWRLRRTFRCVDEFGPFAAFASVRLAPQATVELMVHPGNLRYEAETRSLRASVNDEFRSRYQCVNYRDLQ